MKQYEVIIGTGTAWGHSEMVFVEDKHCEQDAIDVLVDTMEERGDMGFFVTNEEIEEEGIFEDEYVIGGNHCLNLMHYGTFRINLISKD